MCLIVADNFESSLHIGNMAELASYSITSESFFEW